MVWFIGGNAVQAAFWLIPSDVLHGRSAAVGVAAIGSIGMVGSFIGPYGWGVARDFTGSYQAGLLWLVLPHLAAAMNELSGRVAVARPSAPRDGDDRARRAAHRALDSRCESRCRDHRVMRLSRAPAALARQFIDA